MSDPGAALMARLAELEAAGADEIKAEWRRLFRSEPPQLSRDLILRAVAHRLQERAVGGLSKAVQRRLANLIREVKTGGEVTVEVGPVLRPGTRLVREWRGRTHTVTVLEAGFDYAGEVYPSLTTVARRITGAHWSGPRYFGLVRRAGKIEEKARAVTLASSDSGTAGEGL